MRLKKRHKKKEMKERLRLMNKKPLLIAILVYSLFSLATLFGWHARGINTVTGDEPHYLVMSSGIVKHGSLEQTAPYRDEFKAREIYKNGLAPEDAAPTSGNTHAYAGPHGLFNYHNIGLPLMVAVPFLLGGIIGAKLFMVFSGALVVIAAWTFSSGFSENKTKRLWAIIAAVISLPLIPESTQIYPDIWAGLIALMGLYWFFTAQERRTACVEAWLAATIAFLPWLQIKFAATCIILMLSISAKIYFQSKDLKRIFQIFMIAGASCVLLAAYNEYAFGKIAGPYKSGVLELSKTSLMVLIGLFIDQNQGFLLQNPVNLIGVLAMGWMYKMNRPLTLLWALVFLSLIVPNALHITLYGGGSFSGRFQWAAAIVFIIPTLYGLLTIAKSKENIFKLIIISAVLLQLYFFYQYAIKGVSLYNKGVGTWFDAYSIFYDPWHGWLPMLYDAAWAYGYMPNYSWLLLVSALLLVGFYGNENSHKKARGPLKTIAIFSSLFVLAFIAGLSNHQKNDEVIFKAAQLPSLTGHLVNSNRVASPNEDSPGFISFGPYFPLRKGRYEVVFTHKSPAAASETIGWVDVYNATSGKPLTRMPMQGTDSGTGNLKIEFQLTNWTTNTFEFRTFWSGSSDLEIQGIILKTK